jgi:hypothetical protein
LPLNSGVKTIAAKGTPEALGSSTRCESITITALAANTKAVWVGGSDVKASEKKGTPLEKSQTLRLIAAHDHVDDLAQVFVDPEVNGEGVSFSYGHRP